MLNAQFQYGINSSNEKLVHLTLNLLPTITSPVEVVDSNFVFMDDGGAKLMFGALREVPIPVKIKRFIKNSGFVLCTFEAKGYQETIFDSNHQVVSHQRLGI